MIHLIINIAQDTEYQATKKLLDVACNDLDFNIQNNNGESPLHICTKIIIKQKDESQRQKFYDISKYMVLR